MMYLTMCHYQCNSLWVYYTPTTGSITKTIGLTSSLALIVIKTSNFRQFSHFLTCAGFSVKRVITHTTACVHHVQKMTRQTSSKAATQSKSRSFLNFHVFLVAANTSIPRKKWFKKYAQSMWSDRYSANVDILGQLHDFLWLFNSCLKTNILIQTGRKYRVCLPFYNSQCRTGHWSNCFVIEPAVKNLILW